ALNYWKFSLVCLAGAFFAMASCSHPPSSGTTSGNGGSGGSGSTCSGSPGSPCNGTTCDQGLSCANTGNNGENECVSTGSGTGGTTGSGGTTGGGGTVATGGSTGNGGSSTSGSGGTVATGGSTGSGGSPSTGGSTGSGGSSPGNNLITNGDFSQGETNWHVENGTASVNGSQYCASSLNSGALFGWQNMTTPLVLSGSASYTLSYQASGQNNAALHIKVAHAVDPFTPDDYDPMMNNGQLVNDQIGTSLQTFTHTFTPMNGDDSNAGVAFFVESGQNICLANVSLVAN